MRGPGTFFNGPATKRKVDLRGAAAEKTRDQLLAEARKEREERAAGRRANAAALRVQACWRGARSRARERDAARAAWHAAFGAGGERCGQSPVASLPALLFFARGVQAADVPCLVAACVAAASDVAGTQP